MKAPVKTLFTGLIALFGIVTLMAACVGNVGAPAPNEKVASLTFRADQSAALLAEGCKKPYDCRLPNEHLCDTLVVEVFGDGHTVGTCWLKDGKVIRLDGTKDGIPLKCRSHTGQYAVHCLDINNNVALDAVDGNAAVYPVREPSWYRPAIGNIGHDDTAFLTEDTPVGPQSPGQDQNQNQNPNQNQNNQQNPGEQQQQQPTGPTQQDIACRNKAINAFNNAFQQVIQQEGLVNIHYNAGQVPDTSGFFSNGAYQNNAEQICQVQRPPCKQKSHWSSWFGGGSNFNWFGGGCYCAVTNYGPSCYASLMISAAKANACQVKSPECDIKVWSTAVQDATVPAKSFVDNTNKSTDTKAGVAEGIKAGINLFNLFSSFGGFNNFGSPLVLDLEGDGIALTSVTQGVSFDLTGSGLVRTGWIAGDDALLAIDLDGNGRIDSGGELFGEASQVSGFTGGDGFKALSVLDRPENGGNGNGLVEAGDLMYGQLVLWRDANGDGVSQPAELAGLQATGVQALSTSSETSCTVHDAHGNDVSARSSYLRSDGSKGVMIDVYFVTRR